MIIGRVNEYNEAIIPIQLRGYGPLLEAVIDTGFQGADLLLPRSVIRRIGLPPEGMTVFRLANGRRQRFVHYNGEVMWHDRIRQVKVLESGNSCLVSADLLAGSHVGIDMTPGGVVTVTELPAS